jgi:hypothetical protein
MQSQVVRHRRELRLAPGSELIRMDVGSDGRGADARTGALPCLNSNNCTGRTAPASWKQTPHHLRAAFALAMNTTGFVDRFGLDYCGFLTLTFADHVLNVKEGQRRLHSLATHVLSKRYRGWICVLERMKSGRLHYHLIVALHQDIRTGFNFVEAERRCYRSANAALRREWAFWRATAPRYRFGRTELLPIKSNAEGVGRYVGKYIGKHVMMREDQDKGARMVRYGGKFPRSSSVRFQFNSPGAMEWRLKLASFCAHNGISDWNDLQKKCGSKWGYHFRRQILATRVVPPERPGGEPICKIGGLDGL